MNQITKNKKKFRKYNRNFQKYWERDYFFIEENGLPVCLKCGKQMSDNLKNLLVYHFEKVHSEYLNKFKNL